MALAHGAELAAGRERATRCGRWEAGRRSRLVSGGERVCGLSGALGRLRGGCGDRSELGRGRRAGHAEPGRVREEGVDWACRGSWATCAGPEGVRAGAPGKGTG